MLTPVEHLTVSAPYWAQATAHALEDGRIIWLGAHPATTPRLALRWLHHRARDIADQLDSAEARPARHWIDDQAEHERALSALTSGQTYAFTLHDDTTRYELSARPTGSPR